ncbi:hypothetical protein Y032_0189g1221 [Ancylostoma ceylanicum]|nr:hypothetical protein Y032_0189g1221 [Ancylostoma ceylanicum]
MFCWIAEWIKASGSGHIAALFSFPRSNILDTAPRISDWFAFVTTEERVSRIAARSFVISSQVQWVVCRWLRTSRAVGICECTNIHSFLNALYVRNLKVVNVQKMEDLVVMYSELQTAVDKVRDRGAALLGTDTEALHPGPGVSARGRRAAVPPLVYGRLEFTVCN